ncbi:hypothetical protein C8R43DRAFT_962621 [Mycena crocata]|nr:hypothetical protein C8R43DRAFT_962621 [Mycena crocata]
MSRSRTRSQLGFSSTVTTFMGRSAKHLTAAARVEAARGYDKTYSQKPWYVLVLHAAHALTSNGGLRLSTKILRASARRMRHLAETTRKDTLHPVRCIPGLTPLPTLIHDMQMIPLPIDHHFFLQTLAKVGTLDESDLWRWKKEPPFVEDDDDRDPHSEEYLKFTTSIEAVLHGVRMREQNANDVLRRTAFKKKGPEAYMDLLRKQITKLLSDWERVVSVDIYNRFHNPREWAMHRHYIQWLSRTIYRLYYLEFLQ